MRTRRREVRVSGWGWRGGEGATDGRRLRGDNDRGGITRRRERVTAVGGRGGGR